MGGAVLLYELGVYGSYLILLLGFLAGGMIFFAANASETDRQLFVTRLRARWQITRIQVQQSLKNDHLTILLRSSGIPLTATRFQVIRITLVVLAVVMGVDKLVAHGGFVFLLVPVGLWFATIPKNPWPIMLIFDALQKQHQLSLNKQLYRMYVLIKRQLLNYEDRPKTVYHMLREVHPYVPLLQFAIDEALFHWSQDPLAALDMMSAAIGTKQANELSGILKHVHMSDVSGALQNANNRFNSFRDERLKGYKWSLRVRHLILYGLTLLSFGVVSLDIMELFQKFVGSLFSFL